MPSRRRQSCAVTEVHEPLQLPPRSSLDTRYRRTRCIYHPQEVLPQRGMPSLPPRRLAARVPAEVRDPSCPLRPLESPPFAGKKLGSMIRPWGPDDSLAIAREVLPQRGMAFARARQPLSSSGNPTGAREGPPSPSCPRRGPQEAAQFAGKGCGSMFTPLAGMSLCLAPFRLDTPTSRPLLIVRRRRLGA